MPGHDDDNDDDREKVVCEDHSSGEATASTNQPAVTPEATKPSQTTDQSQPVSTMSDVRTTRSGRIATSPFQIQILLGHFLQCYLRCDWLLEVNTRHVHLTVQPGRRECRRIEEYTKPSQSDLSELTYIKTLRAVFLPHTRSLESRWKTVLVE